MRTLTATGHGTVRVTPDAADVRVAAASRADTVAAALAGVEEAVRAVGRTAREHVPADDIASTDLSVWPQHDHQGNPAGHEARHTLTIRCDTVATAGALVGALADEVGDRLVVESVSLVVRDRRSAEDDAREAAYADARRRVEHLALLAGEPLGVVVSASEGAMAVRVGGGVEHAALRSSMDLSFEGGQQAVSTTVTVTWELGG